MKKYKSYIYFLLFILSSFIVGVKAVDADTYNVNLIPVNVTEACDTSNTATVAKARTCLENYATGKLKNYVITNGIVEADQKIMVVVELAPSADSKLVSFKTVVLSDPTQLTHIVGKNGKLGAYLTKAKGYELGYYPLTEEEEDEGEEIGTWEAFAPTYASDEKVGLFADSGNSLAILTKKTPLFGIFYTVNSDVTPGSTIKITLDPKTSSTNASTKTGLIPSSSIILNDLTLNVLSNGTISNDWTFSDLTATGSNGLNYPFGFVASSKDNNEYEFKVPNAVDKITFSGTPTNSNYKIITGLGEHSLDVGDNNILVDVTAEDGTIGTYKIKVRRLSNDATLSSITGTNGVSFGTLSSTTFKYSTTVPYITTSTNISATTTHSEASVNSSHIGNWTIATDNQTDKKNTYKVEVSAEDCKYTASQVPGNVCSTQEYTFEITRTAPSKDLTLKDLRVDGVQVPNFSASKKEYILTDVPANKTNIVITATVNDSKNSITSGTGTKVVNVGDNTYDVIITSEDGKTTDKYTIKLHRLSNESRLQTLTITSNPNGTLSPNFNSDFHSDTGEYTYTYDSSVTIINFSATVKDTNKAYVYIGDANNSDNSANTTHTLNSVSTSFGIATTKVNIIVTAEDGSTSTYIVNLSRQKSTNNYLSELSITPGTIKETFSQSYGGPYTAEVDPEVTSVTVNAKLADKNAELGTIAGNTNFEFGSGNIISIPVYSEDNKVNTYTINVTRKKYNIATLDYIRVGYGTLTPSTIAGYNKNTFSYDVNVKDVNSVPYDTKSIKIEYDKTNEYSIVTGDVGTKSLAPGDNTFTITVKSQDESVTNTYTLRIYRDKNNDNETKGVNVAGVEATLKAGETNAYEVTLENENASLLPSDVKIAASDDATIVNPNTGAFPLSTKNVNIYQYSITAEDGTTENYVIYITRKKSSDVDLVRVYAYAGSSTEYASFCENISATTVCKLIVPVSTTSFRLEGLLSSSEANVVFKEDGTEKSTFNMNSSSSGSSKNIVATVTAEDNTTQDYNIVVERALSSNAALKNLETDANNGGVLSKISGYTDNKTSYELDLTANPFTQDTFKVNIEAYDSKSKIVSINSTGTINNITQATLDVALIELDLKTAGQSTTINFTVEAEDGTQIPYTIKVNRAKNAEPRLSGITINDVDINEYLTGTTFDNDTSKNIESTQYVYDLDFTKLYSEGSKESDKTMLPNSYHTLNIQGTSMDETYGQIRNNGSFQIQTIKYNGNANYINQVKMISCAHDDSICKTYTLNIRRQANNNTDLEDWDTGVKVSYVDDGSTTPTLHNATYDRTQSAGTNNRVYTITVPNKVTEINDDNLVVSVANGIAEWDQLATVAVSRTLLSTTTVPNIVRFTVTAEDGTVETYTLQVIREESNFAALSTLTIVDPETNQVIGTFNKTFKEDSNVNAEYTINIPEGTSKYKIVATASNNGTVAGDGTFTMDSSTEVRNVYAYSENGNSTTTYKLTIVRAANDNKNISSLVVADVDGNTYEITPDVLTSEGTFSGIYDYKATVPGNVDKVIVTATPESVLSQGVNYLGADAGKNNTYSVNVGKNIIRFTVRSEAGNGQSYTVEIEREPKSENRLNSLEYTLSDGTTKTIVLEDNVFDYSIADVPNNITTIYFTATKVDIDSTITGDIGQQALQTGPNLFRIKVNAQNGDEREYTVTVKRTQSDDARLKIFSLTGSVFNETFELGENNVETVVYTVSVSETKEKVGQNDITAIPNNSKATIIYNPEIDLSTNGINIYSVTVKAENGREKRYELRITRPKSTDATLKAVELDGASLQPEFNPNTNEYTITVPIGQTDFTITGIPNVDVATVTNNGTHSLNEGSFMLYVQAEDENISIKSYKFNIVQAKSTDATLGSLTVQGYPLTPGFVKTTTSYSIGDIETSVSQVIINAVPTNINSTVEYYSDGEKITTCESNTKCAVSLKPGLGVKSLVAKVTAPDGITKKEYNISYTKVNSKDAFLESITADAGVFDKEFSQATTTYTLKLSSEIDSVNLTFITSHENASIKVNTDELSYSPKTYQVTDIPEGGSKAVTILVTAQDGTSTKTYNVTVEREKHTGSNDAFLSDLSVTDHNLTTTFRPTDLTYSIGKILYSTATLTINATPNVEESTIEYFVNGVKQTSYIVDIPKESATVSVKVTAGDKKTVKTYTIDFTKEANTDATLTNIIVSKGTLSPTFNSGTYSYNVELGEDEDSIDLTAIAGDSNATMTINNGNYISGRLYSLTNLPYGQTPVTIIVTAEDGTTKLTYQINIVRNSPNEIITSNAYGHTISDGYIRTFAPEKTVLNMKNELDNDNSKLEIWTADGRTKLNDSDTVGTGMIVKLIVSGNVADSKIIIIKGDTTGDGVVDIFDSAAILNHYVDRKYLEGPYLVAGDTTGDNIADIFDSSAVLNHYVGRTQLTYK